MTREAFAVLIHWDAIIWLVGIVNVTAMLPQVHKLITTRSAEGQATAMYAIYLFIQISFSLEGFFRHNTMLMICMALSAIVSMLTLFLILFFRSRQPA